MTRTLTRTARLSLCLLTASLALAACGDDLDEDRSLLERFNVAQGGPDEFLVIERAPIQMPADIRALPAPQPGAASRVDPQVDVLIARAFGTNALNQTTDTVSGGQLALLRAAGATDVPADTRAIVEAEHTARLAAGGEAEGLFDFIIPNARNPYREDQLDPVEELIRLRRQYPGIVTPAAPLSVEQQ